jgi:glucosamine--fructose-6-phosphate aminotransferase (isomerizing)
MSTREETTRMFSEAAQAAEVVRRQLESNAAIVNELGRALREQPPRAIVTCARGSSDHAATFGRYLIEMRAGVLTSSAAPSISSVYAAQPDLRETVLLAISQSGASPDLLASVQSARAAGARIVALVNEEASPLAKAADHVVPLRAGKETSVAATKSYIASLAAIIHLVASWTRDDELLGALERAPEQLARAWQLDWSAALERLRKASGLFVIGRGLGLGIAQEAALKFKETCGILAEGFSAAEVRHGPMALVRENFPVLIFAQNDETRPGTEALAADLAGRGVPVMIAGAQPPGNGIVLPSESGHPVIEPLLIIQSFYRLVNALSLARGFDPDRPPHLNKVTETV